MLKVNIAIVDSIFLILIRSYSWNFIMFINSRKNIPLRLQSDRATASEGAPYHGCFVRSGIYFLFFQCFLYEKILIIQSAFHPHGLSHWIVSGVIRLYVISHTMDYKHSVEVKSTNYILFFNRKLETESSESVRQSS